MADHASVKLWRRGKGWMPAHAKSNDYRDSGKHKHANLRHCAILNSYCDGRLECLPHLETRRFGRKAITRWSISSFVALLSERGTPRERGLPPVWPRFHNRYVAERSPCPREI